MFPLWIWTLNLQASLMVQYELFRICNYSATCPQSKQTYCAHFLEEKRRFYNLWVNKKKISTEEKCYLMGWGEYGVKSKDIEARVGPSQRAENM